MALKGGYQMIDLQGTAFTLGNAQTISGIYEKLEGGYAKPILLTGLNIRNVERRDAWCNFNVEGTTFVASFDDVTVAINDDDEVTFTARSYYLDDIVDSEGNQRFIEGELTTDDIAGVTFSYAKWSLSGTHLMIVLAGTVDNGTVFTSDYVTFADAVLPEYIARKIVPVWSSYIENKTVRFIASDWTEQNINLYLKFDNSTNTLSIIKISGATLTLTAERNFRIQFDLLIDAEEE